MSDPRFSIRFHRTKDAKGARLDFTAAEPVLAVEEAEGHMRQYGVDGQSSCSIFFNGDAEPHYLVFRLTEDRYGLYNTNAVKWPIYFPEGTDDFRNQLVTPPWEVPNEQEEDGSDEKAPTPAEPDADADTSEEEDEEDAGAEDGDDGDGDSDAEEEEPMRLTFFSRMRGPKGWRKKAETDPEQSYQTFIWRVGIQDEEGRETNPPLVTAVFRETDENRTEAKLSLKMPVGAEIISTRPGRIEIIMPTQEGN